jgi:hypothetical protein
MPITHKSMHDIMHLRFSPDGEELLIATGSDEAWLHPLARSNLPFAELDTISQALSGHRIAAQGGLIPLDRDSLSNAWRMTERIVKR